METIRLCLADKVLYDVMELTSLGWYGRNWKFNNVKIADKQTIYDA